MSIILENGIIKTPSIDYDEECGGLGVVLYKYLKKHSERLALINATTDEHLTYEELLHKSVRTAVNLKRRGFKQGDLIAICSNRENIDANVVIVAGQLIGLTTFSLDPILTTKECVDLLSQVQPHLIISIESSKARLQETLRELKIKIDIVCFGKEFEEEFLSTNESENNFEPLHIKNLRDTCMIHFSSGSTSRPKAICLPHYYFMAAADSVKKWDTIQEKTLFNKNVGQVSLRFSNWYWISASLELIRNTACGGCRVLRDKYVVNEFGKLIEKYSITVLFLTPLNCIDVVKNRHWQSYDTSSLERLMTGGCTLHIEYILSLRKLFPGTFVTQSYGMTECSLLTIFENFYPEHIILGTEKPTSCGLPVSGYHYKVIDLDTGKRCGYNQHGELYVKGKCMFTGFYNGDASSSFDSEGYFKTGDLMWFDEDFCFYVADRIKSVLGWNDWLIYPYDIEKVLQEHPAVLEAIVIGIPHKIEGERLMGVVLKNKSFNVTEKELVKFVEARVEDHKRLREGVTFIEEFPLTITGKINRLQTKNKVLAEIRKK
ncbi:luciferin 4-monooxygenase-like [Sitophilus oryzae]|uniref:Luciferin 4-monooxygenase-like n=1 Tax=Sitophilus oryzae TaxID=7048 RepID=A0A6J2XPR1_SITOR|nr:luciferin 4-monooxygenase-like [Sitophilus oryzae]